MPCGFDIAPFFLARILNFDSPEECTHKKAHSAVYLHLSELRPAGLLAEMMTYSGVSFSSESVMSNIMNK